MTKEFVRNFKLLTQMISTGESEEKLKDQAKKVLELGEQIISILEGVEVCD